MLQQWFVDTHSTIVGLCADDITIRGGSHMLSVLEHEALASPPEQHSPGDSPNASEQSTLMVRLAPVTDQPSLRQHHQVPQEKVLDP